MTDHNHSDNRLTFGCPACLAQVNVDRYTADLAVMDDDDLIDIWMGWEHRTDWRARLVSKEIQNRFRVDLMVAEE